MSSKKSLGNNSISHKDDSDVQAKLKQFYEVTKEKLLKMKSEVEEAEKEYEAQKVINNKKNLEYKETLVRSEELDVRIKGMKEKIHAAERTKSNLEIQIKDMNNDITSANKDINQMNLATDVKVKNVKNQANTINKIKENQVGDIQRRIEAEKERGNELKAKLNQIEERMKQLKGFLEENHSIEGKKNDALLKDTADMTKFLAEL